jgi:hypothetical protein
VSEKIASMNSPDIPVTTICHIVVDPRVIHHLIEGELEVEAGEGDLLVEVGVLVDGDCSWEKLIAWFGCDQDGGFFVRCLSL